MAAGIQWSTRRLVWPAKHLETHRPKAEKTPADPTSRKRRLLSVQSVQRHWCLYSCLFAASADQMLDGSASCFQLCPTPAALPEQSSSWMCTSPTAAELSPMPIQIRSKGGLLSLIWPCSGDVGGGGDLHRLSCPCLPVADRGWAGPPQGCPLWVGDCGIKSECLHPSVAGGQRGRSAPCLSQPEIHST